MNLKSKYQIIMIIIIKRRFIKYFCISFLILSPQEIKDKNSKKPFSKYISHFEAYNNADSNGIFNLIVNI